MTVAMSWMTRVRIEARNGEIRHRMRTEHKRVIQEPGRHSVDVREEMSKREGVKPTRGHVTGADEIG